jgi:hypothetical protein
MDEVRALKRHASIPASLLQRTTCSTRNGCLIEPNYIDLRTLAAYASCSVRWLRDRLVDQTHPLPHHRVRGKLLVKKDNFDRWMDVHRVVHPSDQLTEIVESVIAQLRPPRRVA